MCVWMCVCVECVIYVIFQISVTIVDLVECVFAVLLGKYLSYSNNV